MEKIKRSNEFDVVGLLKRVLAEKRTLIKFIIIFALFGIVVALNTPKMYTSQVVLAPEISGGIGMPESLGDIASMVGFDLNSKGSSMDAIYPEIYPDVFASSDFIVKLFNVKVRQDNDSVDKTYYEHLTGDITIPFWEYPRLLLVKMFQKQENPNNCAVNPFRLTKNQDGVYNTIRNNISCQVDKKTNVITISVTDFDKLVAATIADTLQNRLQQYITIYRTQKARTDLKYAQGLFNDTKIQYVKSQQLYASYSDANQDLVLQSFKSKKEELENEMQLRFNIYNQAVQQLQLAKAKVQEKTPAFTIVQGASVPIKSSSMSRSMIVLFYLAFGFVIDSLWVLYFRDVVISYIKIKNKTT